MRRTLLPLAALLLALTSACTSLKNRLSYLCTPTPEYVVQRARPDCLPSLKCDWEDPAWNGVKAQPVNFILHDSEYTKAKIAFRLLYDDQYIYGIFLCRDKYVISTHLTPDTLTCTDNCVEAFIMPSKRGFINTEISVSGEALCQLRPWNPTGGKDGKGAFNAIPFPDGIRAQVKTASSIRRSDTFKTRLINPEHTGAYLWCAEFRIPIQAFATLRDDQATLAGQTWHANFFHCANYSSHPRWYAWAPIAIRNFHTPQYFAPITFAEK